MTKLVYDPKTETWTPVETVPTPLPVPAPAPVLHTGVYL